MARPDGLTGRNSCERLTFSSALFCAALLAASAATAQELPELTQTVNDFAGVVDPESERAIDAVIRSLQQTTGDAVVVATVETVEPYADIRQYAVEMFENRGRGIGQGDRDNGLLVLLAVRDRDVWIEVGYDLEQFITDGYAGETSRQFMIPEFRQGNYGAGLRAGVSRIIGRIAEGRNVTLENVPRPTPARRRERGGGSIVLVVFIAFIVLNAIAGRVNRRRYRRRWGVGPWSGWHSGVGPFGGGFRGGFGGGFGGGGFGGGFGGFGGGSSGGGGGGGSW